MKLIRKNAEKQRAVFLLEDGTYKKIWHNGKVFWLIEHVKLLKELMPEYVTGYGAANGEVWITFNPVPGIPASTFEHTDEFIKKIYEFCLDNIKQTAPYVHGDWSLSNMLIDGDTIRMCDWDNLGIYPKEQVEGKLVKDLIDAFGKEQMLRALPFVDPNVVHQYPGQ